MRLRTGLGLSRRRVLGGGVVPVPGAASAFIPVESTHFPTGAIVDNFHIPTATITTATRADGKTGMATVADVTGTKTLVPNSGANWAPRVETINVLDQSTQAARGTLTRLVFEGAQAAHLKDTNTSATRKFAVFLVGKLHTLPNTTMHVVSAGYPVAEGGTPPAANAAAMMCYFHSTTATDARQCCIAPGLRYAMDGGGSAGDATLDKAVVPQSFCVTSCVSRTTADPALALKFTQSGINGDRVTGVNSQTALNGSGPGWTLGANGNDLSGAIGMDLYQVIVVRWTGDEMTFAQHNQLRADLQAHWDARAFTARDYYIGDSRANQSNVTSSARVMRNAGWPDGPVKTDVSLVQFGLGGSTLTQFAAWLPGGAAPHKLITTYLLSGGENMIIPEWFHNDMGAAQTGIYAGSAPTTDARVTDYLTNLASMCGTMADTVTEVAPIVPLASSGATSARFALARDGAGGVRTAAFITAAQAGNPARNIAPIDLVDVTYGPLPKYDKATTLIFAGNDSGIRLWDQPLAASDLRSSSGSNTDVYWMPGTIYETDNVHPDDAGSVLKGQSLGAIIRTRHA